MHRSIHAGLAAVILFAAPAIAQEISVEMAPATTQINWTVNSALHLVHGTFKLKSGQLKFDPATGAASGKIVVDVPSGESESGARDKRMHKEVLESAKFPEATFTPDKVIGTLSASGPSKMEFHGSFRVHGADHEMTLPTVVERKGNELVAAIDFKIPYVQWGMKDPSVVFLKVDKVMDMHVKTTVRVP